MVNGVDILALVAAQASSIEALETAAAASSGPDLDLCGSVTISSDTELALLAPATRSCGIIGGSLATSGVSNATLLVEAFRSLVTVTGYLYIQNNPALAALGQAFPVLATVGGTLFIQNNDALAALGQAFPVLATVGSNLYQSAAHRHWRQLRQPTDGGRPAAVAQQRPAGLRRPRRDGGRRPHRRHVGVLRQRRRRPLPHHHQLLQQLGRGRQQLRRRLGRLELLQCLLRHVDGLLAAAWPRCATDPDAAPAWPGLSDRRLVPPPATPAPCARPPPLPPVD